MSAEELEPALKIQVVDGEIAFEAEVLVELADDTTTYALVTPLHPVIDVAAVEEEDQLRDLEPDEIKGVWKHLKDALKPHGLEPAQSGEDILMVGTPPESFFEDCDLIELHTEEGVEEWLEVLRMETGEQTYVVLTPLTPIMYGVELNGETGRPLSDAELEPLHDAFAEALADMFGDDEED